MNTDCFLSRHKKAALCKELRKCFMRIMCKTVSTAWRREGKALIVCLSWSKHVWSATEMVSVLTVEPGSDGVWVFLETCTEWQLFLFEPSNDVLLGGAGLCPYHSLIPVMGKTILKLALTILKQCPPCCYIHRSESGSATMEKLPPTADGN